MTTDPDCVFCRIIATDLPSRQVYSDDSCVAFLDISPFHRGHTLVVPRRHVVDVTTADGVFTAIAPAVEQVSALLRDRLGADGINVWSSAGEVAGQDVFHLHVHVVPRYADNPAGLRGLFNRTADDSPDELDAVQAELTR